MKSTLARLTALDYCRILTLCILKAVFLLLLSGSSVFCEARKGCQGRPRTPDADPGASRTFPDGDVTGVSDVTWPQQSSSSSCSTPRQGPPRLFSISADSALFFQVVLHLLFSSFVNPFYCISKNVHQTLFSRCAPASVV